MTSRFFAAFCLRLKETGLSQTGPTEDHSRARFGFTVPRALGKATVRNRIRRRMREAVRLERPSAPDRWAFVFNPRRTVLDARFDELCSEVRRVFTRCSES
jgi:ribonuclease P protein component